MREQFFYGHGKLLLSSEYLVLEGAKALCLPTNVGQTMAVKYRRSYDPKIYWKSFDYSGGLWFEATFDRWKLEPLDNTSEDAVTLSNILKQARKQNVHFLRDDYDVYVETRLEFPIDWGLGSSSSLIYNIAQWAYVSPFELLSKTFGGSGYDIACAQSMGPIVFQNINNAPNWSEVNFNPYFKGQLYFLYLNKKQNSKEAVERFQKFEIPNKEELALKATRLTDLMLRAIDLNEFEQIIFEHENIVSNMLGEKRVQDELFPDYWGAIKSLGAWGGDFALVTSSESYEKTREYFYNRGFKTFLPFDEIICQGNLNFSPVSNEKVARELTLQ